MPRPLLVGRSADKLEAISNECGGLPWTTDLGGALARSGVFDLLRRADHRPPRRCVLDAIEAGKHVYCEKPMAENYGGRA